MYVVHIWRKMERHFVRNLNWKEWRFDDKSFQVFCKPNAYVV